MTVARWITDPVYVAADMQACTLTFDEPDCGSFAVLTWRDSDTHVDGIPNRDASSAEIVAYPYEDVRDATVVHRAINQTLHAGILTSGLVPHPVFGPPGFRSGIIPTGGADPILPSDIPAWMAGRANSNMTHFDAWGWFKEGTSPDVPETPYLHAAVPLFGEKPLTWTVRETGVDDMRTDTIGSCRWNDLEGFTRLVTTVTEPDAEIRHTIRALADPARWHAWQTEQAFRGKYLELWRKAGNRGHRFPIRATRRATEAASTSLIRFLYDAAELVGFGGVPAWPDLDGLNVYWAERLQRRNIAAHLFLEANPIMTDGQIVAALDRLAEEVDGAYQGHLLHYGPFKFDSSAAIYITSNLDFFVEAFPYTSATGEWQPVYTDTLLHRWQCGSGWEPV